MHNDLRIDRRLHRLPSVLRNEKLAALLSSEGILTSTRYPLGTDKRLPPDSTLRQILPSKREFRFPQDFRSVRQEETLSFEVAPDIKVHINAPARGSFDRSKTVQLIIYGLPNGNITEWTIGRAPTPGLDWHFDIQHIGAQTRFLRARLPERSVVEAYLESTGRSWPAWCRRHEDHTLRVARLVATLRACFRDYPSRISWNGHSGGGRLIFAAIDGRDKIPGSVERITFLDSNYGYSEERGHAEKFLTWLREGDDRFLNVFVYNDVVALLKGKPLVSRSGRTWGRSEAMEQDLSRHLQFQETQRGDLRTLTALGGRVQFHLLQNPERKIFHTVLVEKNGFIESILAAHPGRGSGIRTLARGRTPSGSDRSEIRTNPHT